MVQTLKLGSLYLDDKPVTSGTGYRPGQAISFGEATPDPDKAISWVPVNGLLIADRCLLTSISWSNLNAQDLVFGKEIKIQGFQFRSRLLKVGNSDRVPNEWDAALDIVSDNDNLWHWKNISFWGQETWGNACAPWVLFSPLLGLALCVPSERVPRFPPGFGTFAH